MFVLLLLLLPFSFLHSAIFKAPNLDTIKKLLDQATGEDLIIFDIDCTLLIAKDRVLRPCGKDYFLQHFATQPPEQVEFQLSKLLLQRHLQLIDEGITSLIQCWQAHTKIIAISTLSPGSLGAIMNVEKWKNQELARFGFDFSQAFPKWNHIVFGDLIQGSSYPIFKDGILYSAHHTKEKITEEFFRRVKWIPKHLYFIDDSSAQVEAMDKAMEQSGISCSCLHYTYADSLKEHLNKEIAEQQFKTLRSQELWLSDDAFQ